MDYDPDHDLGGANRNALTPVSTIYFTVGDVADGSGGVEGITKTWGPRQAGVEVEVGAGGEGGAGGAGVGVGGAADEHPHMATLRRLHAAVADFEVMGGTFDTHVKNQVLREAVGSLPRAMADGAPPVVCEVGFNAGYSSVTFLLTHPTCRVVSFDIGEHAASFVAKVSGLLVVVGWLGTRFTARQ